MELHWEPVGPLPAATYWRRRAALATGLVLLLVLLTSLLGGGDDDRLAAGDPAPSPSATGEPSVVPSASASPSPSTAEPALCADTDLKVEATTDAESYAVGATPRLSLSVTNTGARPCRRGLGQASVELVITSGSDRIWSSDDCAPGGEEGVTVLQPGAAEVSRATWSGRRSQPGACTGEQPAAAPGTYRVSARVGELRVEGAAFRLTG